MCWPRLWHAALDDVRRDRAGRTRSPRLPRHQTYTLALYEDGNLLASALGGDHLPPAGYPPATLDPAGTVLEFRGERSAGHGALCQTQVLYSWWQRLTQMQFDLVSAISGLLRLSVVMLAIAVFAMAGWLLPGISPRHSFR